MTPDRLTLPENLTEQRLTDLCDWWLQVACDCGRTTYFSLLFMASHQPTGKTLRGVMARLRCQMCNKEPTGLALVDDPAKDKKSRGGSPQVRVAVRGV